MIILRVLYLLAFVSAFWFVCSQLVVPLIAGTKVFPWFRSPKQKELQRELEDVAQAEKEAELAAEVKARKEALDKQNTQTQDKN